MTVMHRIWAECVGAIVALLACAHEAGAAEAVDAASQARALLDRPLVVALQIAGWPAVDFEHESDLFSTWGHLVLRRRPGYRQAVEDPEAALRRSARRLGWTVGSADQIETPPDLPRLGVTLPQPTLTLNRAIGGPRQSPPTRYLLRTWRTSDGQRLVVQFRVDGE